MNDKNSFKLEVAILSFALLSSCTTTTSAPTSNVSVAPITNLTNAASAKKAEEHEHHPPHGGTLVVLGKEFAHIELVLDKTTGQLTAYALDGEADNAVKIAQPEIEIKIEKPVSLIVKLKAVENSLTGEKRGDTSEFAGQNDALKNLNDFDGEIQNIFIKGQQFQKISFNFPKGNEND